MELTYRQYKILSLLIQAQGCVTSNLIAQSLKITRRTLISDIKVINTDEKLIDSNNSGYFINPGKEERVEELLMFFQEKEDHSEILKYLLVNRDKIKCDQITEKFFISDSALQKYVSDMNHTLSDYSLKIVRRNNYYIIEGEEINKRALMAKMIHQEAESFFDDMNNFSSYFPNIEVEEVSDKIIEIVQKENYAVPKYYELNFLINVLVILSRNPFIKETCQNYHLPHDKDYPEVRIAQAIVSMMAAQYMIQYINPSQVVHELDMCLYGFIKPKGNDYEAPTVHFLSESFVSLIRKRLAEVFNDFYLFTIDYESFLNVFCVHVSELIKRCSNSQNFMPTNLSLKNSSPFIYEIAVSIAVKISEAFHIHIPDSEINLIAIHIGYTIDQALSENNVAPVIIVSDDYNNIGSNIAKKIADAFVGKVQIMGFFNRINDIPYRDFKDYFIISTTQYQEQNSKICYISPFFSYLDQRKVNTAINEYLKRKEKEEFSRLFDTYISDDCFFSIDQKMDKYEAIRFLVDQAEKNKDVNENFYDQVLEREKYSSTSFFGKFAIPHSNVQNANTTKLYIMINHEGVDWNGEIIKLIFLILIDHEAASNFRKLYSGITETLYHSNTIFENINKISNMNDLKKYLLI